MSSLTEEQRKRIEENRLKALQKREALLKSRANNNFGNNSFGKSSGETISCQATGAPKNLGTGSNSNLNSSLNNKAPAPQISNSFYKSSNNISNGSNSQKLAFLSGNKDTKSTIKDFLNKNNNVSKPVTDKPLGNFYSEKNSSTQSTSKDTARFYGKKITGNFTLCDKERFIVNAPYHAQMIDIFKSMPTKQYDVNTKRWSFSIGDHSALVTALNQLRPEVCISPLPNYVLQVLKKSSNYPRPASIDLMSLDPLLLEAFMPFQREGVCFGISRQGKVLIADDMGLGKTIQALGIATFYRREWPLLIITPSSVRYSWAEAIENWVGGVDSYEVMVVNSGKDSIEGTVVIMSYDLLSRRAKEVQNLKFQVIIMDESHMLKNFKTSRYRAAAPLMKSAKRLILLSGTPALSRPNELYTQISAVDPKLIPNFQDYGIRYCDGKQQPWGWDFSGSSNMQELQIILQASIMIRRLKSDVISQLPPKQRMTIVLDPSSIKLNKSMMAAASVYNDKYLKGSEKQGALLQFFNETSYVKAKAVCDYIKELLTEGEKKFLVFAHHRVMLNKISELCEEQKVHYIRIDGTTSSESRPKLVDNFQNSPDTRVAVLSITAANAGITLTAAHLVVFAELYWNPGLLVQAEDRVHRIGQEDSVLVQYLVAKGTADDAIWPLVQSKLDTLNKAGLSKDNFSSAATSNQKVKNNEGILKYCTKFEEKNESEMENVGTDWENDLKDEDLLGTILDLQSDLSNKRKRSEDDE